MFQRFSANPVIRVADVKPSRPDFKVDAVLNPAVAQVGDETMLLARVAERPSYSDPAHPTVAFVADGRLQTLRLERSELEQQGWDFSDSRTVSGPGRGGRTVVKYLTSISHLRRARSTDGLAFTIDDQPFLAPGDELETWGCEDARITQIGDMYVITYSGVSPMGILTKMATTRDFVELERRGVMLAPENRNVAIFPRMIGGLYYAFNRPVPQMFGYPAIWLADSPDLTHWGNQRFIMGTSDTGWESGRVGAAFAPVWTEDGWVFIYHAADASNRYCLGAMLLDAERPWIIKAKLPRPVLEPEAPYETEGFFANVVFSCGGLVIGDRLRIYYGAADEQIAVAEGSVQELLAALREWER
jgi:predicted GH43/DUF377 family glycosyl hydrolase